jgi:APA family basic amino acid/polyamine antiporter
MFAHASILGLRVRQPKMRRPFKLGWNIGIKGRQLPVSAIVGLLATSAIWIIILITQSYSRWVGLGWMCSGLIIYFILRCRRPKRPSEEWKVKPPKKP